MAQEQPVSAGPVRTLEFYEGSLFAVDVPPGSPEPGFLVDGNAARSGDPEVGPVPVLAGQCHDGKLTGAHVKSVVYPRDNDGTLRRVSTYTDNRSPTETPRVSSEDNASVICDARVGQDLVDHLNSRFVYQLPGTDCTDPQPWKIVRLSDDDSVDPDPFPGRPVSALNDISAGAHAGWLVVEGGVLKRLDADNNVQADNLATVSNSANSLARLSSGIELLNIDGELRAFDPAQNALTDSIADISNLSGFGSDGEELYFVDDQTLLRTDIENNTTIVIDDPSDGSSFGTFNLVQVGLDRVVWGYTRQDPNTGEVFQVLRTVDKTATGTGTASDLDTVNLQNGTFLPAFGGNAPGWVFYTEVDVNTSQPTAIAKRMDGSATETFDMAQWLGGGLAADRTVGSRPVSKVYRLDGVTDFSDWTQSAVTAKSVAPDDPGATPIDLGPLPDDIQNGIFIPGFGPDRLAPVSSDDGTGNDTETDVIYFNETETGSLLRLTDTDGVDEAPVALF